MSAVSLSDSFKPKPAINCQAKPVSLSSILTDEVRDKANSGLVALTWSKEPASKLTRARPTPAPTNGLIRPAGLKS
jgi:hypothetical protein